MNFFIGFFLLFLARNNAANNITDQHQSKDNSSTLMDRGFMDFLSAKLTPEQDIKFYLFTRRNPIEPVILKVGDTIALRNSNFTDISTKIIIHGWKNSADAEWINKMRKNYIKSGDYNVIAVDWAPPASKEYLVCVKTTKKVGEYVSQLLKFLMTEKVLSMDNIHIVGHSLGAHVAGFSGRNLFGKIARITGLDPARPAFEVPFLQSPADRLDKNDAQFVDVIHTSSKKVGFEKPIGHADFYPNGGKKQPGCPKFPFMKADTCNHGRAHEFMSESILNSYGFPAVKCNGWSEFKSKKYNVSMNHIVFMGEKLDTNARGMYYLQTNAKFPFGRGRI